MIKFYKYHGAGNDFIMINNMDKSIALSPINIALLCNRHFGIGADGVIMIEESKEADCFMNYYNSDGTLAEMCGNGVRCTAKFFIEQTGQNKKELKIETRSGIKMIKVNENDTYSVNMGVPKYESVDFPSGVSSIYDMNFDCVSMGNPHAVSIVNKLEDIDLKNIGPKVENNPLFPNKINVEFVEKIDKNYFKVAVWERGCGVTLACGTGACAVFSILDKKENFKDEIILEFYGGKLLLSKNINGEIILRGSADFVFEGEVNI